MVAVALRLHIQQPRQPSRVSLDGFREGIIRPLLGAVVTILDRAELYGRSILELRIGDLSMALTHDNGDPETDAPSHIPAGVVLDLTTNAGHDFPRDLPLGGEISLPLDIDAAEIGALADQWRDDVGRAMGLETLRG